MFQAVKGFRKADLKFVAEELDEIVPPFLIQLVLHRQTLFSLFVLR